MNQLCYNFHSIFCYVSTLLLHYYRTFIFSLCFATSILLTHDQPVASVVELILSFVAVTPQFLFEDERRQHTVAFTGPLTLFQGEDDIQMGENRMVSINASFS